MEHTYDFDLAVIGSGPGGQKAAIMAAKLGHKVCVIDSKSMVGGRLRQHWHDPVQDIAGSSALPHRHAAS
jgi:flavin-dependent dehydrogenase